MREQRDWCCVATLNPKNGSRCIYAIGGKNYSQVELRSIEKYNLDSNKWESVKTMLNMYDGIFMSVTTFENRFIYIMNRDSTVIELFDTEANDTMCSVLPL